ncbi:Mg-chelatase subunit ChlD [Deinococcus phoenicis]|uniref:Mg-chelatase subunit ChlD n=1 Tax=Deinococcus phoenicis TaxID=1476583 RepID=A0A016QUB7_9DEIO|nr:VWA domain-containing protein [Deinococcus phoenicis]EYB69477.1 Mg-chelatase subunit ChlD [Deinococcus phoenicis]
MSFGWPWALVSLGLVPVLAWLYLRGLARPAGAAALHPDLRLLAQAAGRPHSLRRHLPAVLYLLALTLALLALARPTAPLPHPDNRTTIMLAIDMSRSMESPDIEPNRFVAAQVAARNFVQSLPEGARVGLASFAGFVVLNTPPTARHAQVFAAIDGLTMANSTAIGDGLLEALHALPGRGPDAPAATPRPAAAIVLLSDGRNNSGSDPLAAAAQARRLAVKVYTVGLGTESGNLRSNRWNGFRGGLDTQTLRQIAATTGGRYFEARSAAQLSSIYRDLGRSLGWTVEPREVAGPVAALAGLVLLASLAVSELFTRRLL